ncbi:MAG: WXG100 family type VII secretion target [Aquihabitans sp.]
MTFLGANPEQLDELAASFDDVAGRLDGEFERIMGRVVRSHWEGEGATAFRQSWSGPARKTFKGASSQLKEAATTLRRNAEDQRRASAASAASGTAGAGGAKLGGGGLKFGELPDGFMDFLFDMAKNGSTLLDLMELGELWMAAKSARHFFSMADDLAKAPGIGELVSLADYLYQLSQHGWWDGRTMWSGVDGIGGGVATLVAGPAGGLAWSASTFAGEKAGRWLDDAGTNIWYDLTGSSDGYLNSMYFKRKYGVFDPADLPIDVRSKAVADLNDRRTGPMGFVNTMVIDPMANQWWFLKEVIL